MRFDLPAYSTAVRLGFSRNPGSRLDYPLEGQRARPVPKQLWRRPPNRGIIRVGSDVHDARNPDRFAPEIGVPAAQAGAVKNFVANETKMGTVGWWSCWG